MLRWIVENALRLRSLTLAAGAALVVLGVPALRDAPLDVFPEFAPPLVEIQTEAPGLSTETVESLVTIPIENAVNGVPWLDTMRSKSVLGLSSVVLLFHPGTDVLRARQLVQERVARVARQLPQIVRPPVMLPPLSATSRVMKIGITSPELSLVELSALTRWSIRPRLLSVPGVANVAVWGQRNRELQVLVDPDRLMTHGVSIDQIVRASGDAVAVEAGGFVDTPNQRLAVTHVSPVHTAEDLAAATLAFRNGAPILLGDVAEVTEGFPPLIGDGVVNDQIGLLLIVEKQPTGNTLDVTRGVESAIEAMRAGLPGVEIDTTIFRPASFIEMSISNLERSLFIGAVLVVLVLVSLLYEWRAALISALAIPVSLLAAALVLLQTGQAINTMVLAGLAIALGSVVDDAIVDVENILRRLRLNAEADSPEPVFSVVLRASLEVRSAVLLASVIIVLVLVPVFFLPGLAGAFFRPLAAAYILAIMASLVVALTLTPALALWLLPESAARGREAPLARFLRVRYRALLPALLERRDRAVPVLLGVLAVGGAGFWLLGQEFMPRFKEYDFLMHWVEKPGTSIEAMDRITIRASQELRSVPGVRNFGAHIGRAEAADEVVGPNFTELWISLDPDVDYDASVARIQEIVDGYPGLYRDLLTYLKERIKEVLSGASASLVVRIYGPDLEGLRAQARVVAEALAEVPGVADLKVEPQVSVPHVEVALLPEAAARFGVSSGQMLRSARTLIQGISVGQVYEGQQTSDVVVRGTAGLRSDPTMLHTLPIEAPDGSWIPLGEVADVRVVATPNLIHREGASRRIDVTCNVRGRDLGAVARDIEERVREVPFQAGYHPELLGEYKALQEAGRRLTTLGALCLLGIFLLLEADFRSRRLALLVFASLPFALVGGVLGAWLGGGVLSLGSLVGFVAVLGIAVRNGILLISHYRHLREQEGVPFGTDLVLRGAEERLAPILMTALTTALALLPIVVGGERPGQEIEHPMALVILGGLVSSTLLNLLVVPALYLRFGDPQAEAAHVSIPNS